MVILVDDLLATGTWSFIVSTFASLISAVASFFVFDFETFFVGCFWKLLILSKLRLFADIFLLLLSKEAKTAFTWLFTTIRSKAFISSTITSNTAILISYLEILFIVLRSNFPYIITVDISFRIQTYSLSELLLFLIWTNTHIIGAAILIFIDIISYGQTSSSNWLLILITSDKFRLYLHLHFLGEAG